MVTGTEVGTRVEVVVTGGLVVVVVAARPMCWMPIPATTRNDASSSRDSRSHLVDEGVMTFIASLARLAARGMC